MGLAKLTGNGGGESFRVLHQHLSQLLAPDVGGPDEDDRSLVVSTRVVQAHLFIGKDLLCFFCENTTIIRLSAQSVCTLHWVRERFQRRRACHLNPKQEGNPTGGTNEPNSSHFHSVENEHLAHQKQSNHLCRRMIGSWSFSSSYWVSWHRGRFL